MTTTTNIRDEELLLYITTKLKDAKSNGSILLNKVLYYADNIHFLEHGRAISSFRYVNRTFGPTPNPAQFLPLRTLLISSGRVREENFEDTINNRNRKKLVPIKPYSESLFSKDELATLKKVIDELHDLTATEVSDLSHDELGWQLTKEGEEIPFHAFALSIPELNEDEFIWVEDELKKVEAA